MIIGAQEKSFPKHFQCNKVFIRTLQLIYRINLKVFYLIYKKLYYFRSVLDRKLHTMFSHYHLWVKYLLNHKKNSFIEILYKIKMLLAYFIYFLDLILGFFNLQKYLLFSRGFR